MSEAPEMEKAEKAAFNDINEISSYIAALGDPRGWKVKLFRSKPTLLADGTKCDGHLTNIESPDELEEDRVREAFGGGDFYILGYKVGEKGFKKRWNFHLGGAPTLPVNMRDARVAAAGPQPGGNGTPADTTLGAKAMDIGARESDRHAREREERDREIRILATDKAKAESEATMLKARVAELEQRPIVAREERTAAQTEASNMMRGAMEMLQLSMKQQAEISEARARAAESALAEQRSLVLQEREKARHEINHAGEPFKQILEIVTTRHQSDMASSMQNFQNMLTLQNQMHMQQMEQMRLSLREKDEKRDKKNDLKELADLIEMVKGISGGGDKSVLELLIDKGPALLQQAPGFAMALAAAGRTAVTGTNPIPNLPVQPALPAEPVAPAAPQLTPEQQAEQQKVAELVIGMKDLIKRKVEPVDAAQYIYTSIGKGHAKLMLTAGPVEQVVAFMQQADPIFAGPTGEMWVRGVYVELTKLVK